MSDIVKGYEPCALGCGLSHRVGLRDPIHSVEWLTAERNRLRGLLARIRGWAAERVLSADIVGMIDDVIGAPSPPDELAAARARRLFCAAPRADGAGCEGHPGHGMGHWMGPRPTNPDEWNWCCACGWSKRDHVGACWDPFNAEPRIETTATDAGVSMDVDLGPDPEHR